MLQENKILLKKISAIEYLSKIYCFPFRARLQLIIIIFLCFYHINYQLCTGIFFRNKVYKKVNIHFMIYFLIVFEKSLW